MRLTRLTAAAALLASAAATAGPIAHTAFSGSETVFDFETGNVSTSSDQIGLGGAMYTDHSPGSFWFQGNFGAQTPSGASSGRSLAIYDSATDVTVTLNGIFERVGIDIGFGAPNNPNLVATYAVTFLNAAFATLGTVNVSSTAGSPYRMAFAGWEDAAGVYAFRVVETSGGNGNAGIFDNLRYENQVSDPEPVPEPASLALLGLGLGALAFRRRKA